MATTVKQVKEVGKMFGIGISRKAGKFTARIPEYVPTSGSKVKLTFVSDDGKTESNFGFNPVTVNGLAATIRRLFPEAQIESSGEVWRAFKATTPVSHQSSRFVNFSI